MARAVPPEALCLKCEDWFPHNEFEMIVANQQAGMSFTYRKEEIKMERPNDPDVVEQQWKRRIDSQDKHNIFAIGFGHGCAAPKPYKSL